MSFGELVGWSAESEGEEGGEDEGDVVGDVRGEVLWRVGGGVGGSLTDIDGACWSVEGVWEETEGVAETSGDFSWLVIGAGETGRLVGSVGGGCGCCTSVFTSSLGEVVMVAGEG